MIDQDDVPIGRARVRLYRGPVKYEVDVDAHGTFTFPDLSPGLYRLYVEGRTLPDGYLPPWQQHVSRQYTGRPTGVFGTAIRLTEGEQRVVDLRIFAAGSVRGRIVEAGGKPVEKALVSARSTSGISEAARTDERGRFLLDRVYPGEYTTSVRLDPASGLSAASSPLPTRFELFPGEHRELPELVAGVGGHVIAGLVVDDAGQPVANLPVVCHELGETERTPTWRTTTDAEGRYELGRIPSTLVAVTLDPEERPAPEGPGLIAKAVAPIPVDLRGAPEVFDAGITEVERSHPFRLECRVRVDPSWVEENHLERFSIEVGVKSVGDDGPSRPVSERSNAPRDSPTRKFTWACDTPHEPVVLTVVLSAPAGVEHERLVTVHPVADAARDVVVAFP